MVALGMAGLVVGFVLGLRYSAFVLLPVALTALCVALCFGAAGHVGWLAALLGFSSFCLSSQASYTVALALPAVLRSRSHGWVINPD